LAQTAWPRQLAAMRDTAGRCRRTRRLAVAFAAAAAAVAVLGAPPQPQHARGGEAQQQPVNAAARVRRERLRASCAPELGLVTKAETAVAFAKHAQSFCNSSSPWAERTLRVREVLGFVVPWNDYGYRAARYFHGKLTQVSPLWFRVLPGRGALTTTFEIAGQNVALAQELWVKKLSSEHCQVLPTFSLEGWESLGELRTLLEDPRGLAGEVAAICEHGRYAGAILDVRLALFPNLKRFLPGFVAALGRALHDTGRRFVLSVPAPIPADVARGHDLDFDARDAAAVAGSVDAVIVNTRDFSRAEAGPAAPLPWVRESVERLLAGTNTDQAGFRAEQLLLEIPTYGRAFPEERGGGGDSGGRVVLAAETVKALARQRPPLVWDNETAEHSANLTKSRVHLSVPTLAFVVKRLRLARSLGIGVALRELGSGLDYVFDLLPTRSATPPPRSAEHEEEGVGSPASRLEL